MRAILVMLLALWPALSLAKATVPDTPAGRMFGTWLESFNGDRAGLESFIKTHAAWMNLEDHAKWRAQTGGCDLLEVYSGDQTNVFFRLKSRTNGSEEVGRMQVSATRPITVTSFGTWRAQSGAKFEPVTLDDTTRARVIDRAAAALDGSYVYPDVGRKMSAALRRREARGDYRAISYGEDFAKKLTEELHEISHDKHVEVRFSYLARPLEPPKQSSMASRRLIAVNCGFEKAEHLPPNIGYLKFDLFSDPKVCAPTAGAAMTLLSDSDALILDLRDNSGGSPGMVEFLASYLFDERTHLDDTYSRVDDSTREAWTLPYVPGKKFIGKPVFVLTSHRTFSAAEGLSYALKNLKRATLVGETTLGGAHPTETRPIDDHFSVRVPYARSINPITKTNWEGTGVEPDVKVPAAEALEVALKLAAGSGDDR